MPYRGNSQFYRPRSCGRPDPLSPSSLRPWGIVIRVVRSTWGDRILFKPKTTLSHYPIPFPSGNYQSLQASLTKFHTVMRLIHWPKYLKDQMIFSHICPVQRAINSIASGQDYSILLQHFEEASKFEARRISRQLMP